MYSALPFGFAQVLVEVPYSVIQALLYGVITYALICFEWTAAKFWYYILFTVLVILFFTYYGEVRSDQLESMTAQRCPRLFFIAQYPLS